MGKGKLEEIVTFAENKLFVTLDTTVRKVVIANLPFLLTDTVGYIRKLPTHLVESFKSTLDEVRDNDILVHVVDISHPQFEKLIEAVMHPERNYSQLLMNKFPQQYDVHAPTLFEQVQAVLDHISAMTDVYALNLYRQLDGISIPTV